MTSHAVGRPAVTAFQARNGFASILAGVERFANGLMENSGPMRCSREADRLFRLSDAELARLGLTRDRIIPHAFARYLSA